MKKGIVCILAVLLLFPLVKIQGQNNEIDSLNKVYRESRKDTVRIPLLLKIGAEYQQINTDSALSYFFRALEIAQHAVIEASVDKNASEKYKKTLDLWEAKSLSYVATIQRGQGSYSQAIENCSNALKIYKKFGASKGISICYNDLGLIYKNQGMYDMAIENYMKSLKNSEEIGFRQGMSWGYNNIGGVHWHQENYDLAVENFRKSLEIYKEAGDKRGMSLTYCNIGLVYLNQEKYIEALDYSNMSLEIDEQLGDEVGMSYGYSNIGVINENQGRYELALENYRKSLVINEKIGDRDGIALLNSNIASTYLKHAEAIKRTNPAVRLTYLDSALMYANKAYELSVEIGALPMQNTAAIHLQNAYTQLGNCKEALRYAEVNIATYDSMFTEEKAIIIAEMTTKYEAEKKQLQIDQMENQKQLDDKIIETQQLRNRKQQIVILSTILGFIIVLVFSLVILRMLREKRKANALLAEQNDEIVMQNEKIEEQNRNITDSIVYAQRIQHALLPPGDYVKQLLPHRFILYKPRDIVSGDFYWVSKKGRLIISVAADCTGHGVPGAMMSMLGVSILNEIVNSIKKADAGKILNSFRKKLIESLHQGGGETHMFDGIDLALCLLDLKENQLQFAGANCPLYMFRDGTLREIKGDKMPIGIHARMEAFSTHNIEVESGDMLYIFSDGFADQFGGLSDKRFTQRRFRELLTSIHQKSMIDQKEILDKTLEEWKGESAQIDDILVMGIRI